MLVLYRLICMVYGREGPGVEFKVRHSNHVKVHASDATIIVRLASTRNSGTQILYQI